MGAAASATFGEAPEPVAVYGARQPSFGENKNDRPQS
jgi:hypothetical protein